MAYGALSRQVESHVVSFYQNNVDPTLKFHNLIHIRKVVTRAREISDHYHLWEAQRFALAAAAWFHDIGYLSGGQPEHELRGAEQARKFLFDHHVGIKIVDEVVGCIRATAFPQHPSGLLQQIICDADLFHFGTPEMFACDRLMQGETESLIGEKITDQQWLTSTIRMLESHMYHTRYCRERLTAVKHQNVEALKIMLYNGVGSSAPYPSGRRTN